MTDYPSTAKLNAYLVAELLGWIGVRWNMDHRVYVGKRPNGTADTPVPDLTLDPAHYGELLRRLVIMHGHSVDVGHNEDRSQVVVTVTICETDTRVQAEGRTIGLALVRAAWLANEEAWG